MRHLKTVGWFAAAVCALCVAAAPAMAAKHHFITSKLGKMPISEEFPAKTTAVQVGSQTWKFNGIHIHCERARATGTVVATELSSFATAVKFSECLTEIKFGAKEIGFIKTTFNGGHAVTFVYHPNGYVELGTETEEEGSEVSISGGEATMFITGLKCTIHWPAQTVPAKAVNKPEEEYSSAVYSNIEVPTTALKSFPSGFQKRLVIANEFKQMEYSIEGGSCEEFLQHEFKGGKYVGTLEEQVVGGNLSFL